MRHEFKLSLLAVALIMAVGCVDGDKLAAERAHRQQACATIMRHSSDSVVANVALQVLGDTDCVGVIRKAQSAAHPHPVIIHDTVKVTEVKVKWVYYPTWLGWLAIITGYLSAGGGLAAYFGRLAGEEYVLWREDDTGPLLGLLLTVFVPVTVILVVGELASQAGKRKRAYTDCVIRNYTERAPRP